MFFKSKKDKIPDFGPTVEIDKSTGQPIIKYHPDDPAGSDAWMGTREKPHRRAVWDETLGKMRRKTPEEIAADHTPEARRARELHDRELYINSLDTEAKKEEARERYRKDDAWKELDEYARGEQARLNKESKVQFRIAEDHEAWDARTSSTITLFHIQVLTYVELRIPGVSRSNWGYGDPPRKEDLEVFEHWSTPRVANKQLNVDLYSIDTMSKAFPSYQAAEAALKAGLTNRPIAPKSVVKFDQAGNKI